MLSKYKKYPMNFTITIAYERYFADRFKTYDTFYSFAFRKDKGQLKRTKKDGIWYVNENDIIRYFRKQEIKELRKIKYIELLHEIAIEGNLSKAGELIGFKHTNQIYEIYNGRIGSKTIKLLKRNYKNLIGLLNQKGTSCKLNQA
jgi:hypothetical protein